MLLAHYFFAAICINAFFVDFFSTNDFLSIYFIVISLVFSSHFEVLMLIFLNQLGILF